MGEYAERCLCGPRRNSSKGAPSLLNKSSSIQIIITQQYCFHSACPIGTPPSHSPSLGSHAADRGQQRRPPIHPLQDRVRAAQHHHRFVLSELLPGLGAPHTEHWRHRHHGQPPRGRQGMQPRLCRQWTSRVQVLVAPGVYSEVHAFTHRDPAAVDIFVTITTQAGSITLTPNHYLLVNERMSPAKLVRPGDVLTDADASLQVVTSVSLHKSTGLYNPQTLHGNIVVVRGVTRYPCHAPQRHGRTASWHPPTPLPPRPPWHTPSWPRRAGSTSSLDGTCSRSLATTPWLVSVWTSCLLSPLRKRRVCM